MKNNFYIVIGLTVSALIVWIIFKGIDVRENKPELLTGKKIPFFRFNSHKNKYIDSKSVKDKVYVVEFFFTKCPTVCVTMNKNMLLLQKEFINDDDFAIISFTVDPENDNIEVLGDYAKKLGVFHKNWFFLTGKKEKIYKLARKHFLSPIMEDSSAEGGFLHTQLFTLIDKKGNIRYRLDNKNNPLTYDGTKIGDIQKIKKDIRILLNE